MKITLTLILFITFSLASNFIMTAQKTEEQKDLIETINTKIKNAALNNNFTTSIVVWKKELRVLNRFKNIKFTVDIDKIKNVSVKKQNGYYQIKIFAPWGIDVPTSGSETKLGTAPISARMKNKKLVKSIVLDIKTLIASYQIK
ncbi:hypothetical protein [Maribacter litoralis]|uniref:DUF4468 domain-containing protein n=1 Tax=Maribacter litoralis TaxID=2059726 RepID=A0A653W3M2_9FLAO|nr:hypothetical protein [Maribacter litoralis]VXC12981.1 exported hypothetical protein [Maribacter litoralis]